MIASNIDILFLPLSNCILAPVVSDLNNVLCISHPAIVPAVLAVSVEQVIAPLTTADFNTAEVALITPFVATLKFGV